jgi:hypothetical protein
MNLTLAFVLSTLLSGCSADRKELGSLPAGANAALTLDKTSGKWGLEITGGPSAALLQKDPVQIQLYLSDDNIIEMAAGYDKVTKRGGIVEGSAVLNSDGGAAFNVVDEWSMNDNVLIVKRTLSVDGSLSGAGFYSAIRLQTTPDVAWADVSFLAPGLLYGDPTYDGPRSPGGTLSDDARNFTIRQDFMPAPLYGMTLPDGGTVTMLDMAPNANTTLAETQTGLTENTLIDEKVAVGAFGSNEAADGSVQIGFWMPATVKLFPRQPRRTDALPPGTPTSLGTPATLDVPSTPPAMVWNRRYNPVQDGFTQNYTIGFRFASAETFPELTRNSYRWAWDVLKPQLHWHDMEVVRRSLADQLSSQVYTFEDRTGFPFIVYTHSGEVWRNERDPNFYWRATMGFVGKNIEAADQLLRESERDPSERGQRMRQQALDVIATFIREVPMKEPFCTGFNLKDGKPSMTNPPVWYVREATEDMRMLLEAYRRELNAGREHPEWLQWCKDFADWLIPLQRADGSFPRSFMINTSEIVEESGTTSYNVVPMFVLLSRETGDNKYLESAAKAAEYVWQSFGRRGVFIGGAIDNPNITDKEAGMLSMQAFLFLHDATGDPKWLEMAKTAGDFAATWTWLWNVPMPLDADDDALMWKRDITTVGVQGITAQVAGHVDQYLDIAVPDYVKLYRLTGDEFYLDFAKILLHNCKGMMAIPGRLHGMIAPGFQTENWRMGAAREGRGFGAPEKWMPWVTTNHLYGIYSLEENDKEMYDRLTAK